MKLKIGLDLDGVIIDHTITKIKLAKQCGYFLKPVETSSEIMKKLIPLDIYRGIQSCLYEKAGLTSKQKFYLIPMVIIINTRQKA